METAIDKMASDKEFQKGFSEYNSMSELSYIRMDSFAAPCFRQHPRHRSPARRRKRSRASSSFVPTNRPTSKRPKTKIKISTTPKSRSSGAAGCCRSFFGER